MRSPQNLWQTSAMGALCCALLFVSPGSAAPPVARSKSKTSKAGKINPFAGLPPMKASGKEVFFRFRPGPRPPGKIGTRVRLPFPPPAGPKAGVAPTIKRKPLKVMMIRPNGKTKLVGAVTVTFNQPMIPLSSVSDAKLEKPPFQISPEPPGRFRWLGTSTAAFEPKGRMPYSTKYTVTVPQGTQSDQGTSLKRTRTATFQTPRLKITQQFPHSYSPERPGTWIGLRFNQDIRQDALGKALDIQGPGGDVAFEIVPPSAWGTHKRLGSVFKTWDKKRSIVLKPYKPLPKASTFNITIKPGAYGEGPLQSRTLRNSFKTFGPMVVEEGRCSWQKKFFLGMVTRCQPTTSIWFRFSNSVGPSKLKQYVQTTPSFKDLRIVPSGRMLYLSRPEGWPAESDMKITIKAGLKDVYGQTLQSDYTMSVRFMAAQPMIQLPRNQHATIERKSRQRFTVQMRNISSYRLRMKYVQAEDIPRYRHIATRLAYYNYKRYNLLNGLTFDLDKRIKTGKPRNQIFPQEISVRQLTRGKAAFVFVILTSNDLMAAGRYASPHRALVVQLTDTGITARYGYAKIALLLTRLSNGKAISNADLQLFHYTSTSGYQWSGSSQQVWKGKTDSRGYALLPGAQKFGKSGPMMLLATQGKDQAYVILDGRGTGGYTYGYSRWSRIPPKQIDRYFLFSERSPYKPGETVHLRGVLRRIVQRPKGGVIGLAGKKGTIEYTIRSPRWQIVKKGKAPLQAGGTFSINYQLKELADLGNYRVQGWANVKGQRFNFYGTFMVQAYRAPEYKVNVRVDKGPFFLGQSTKVGIQGRYTFGAAMRDAQTTWQLRRSAGSFQPPRQLPGFRFGITRPYSPYWRSHHGYRGGRYGRYYRHQQPSGTLLSSGKGKLNAKGQLDVNVTLKSGKLKGPGNFVFEAQVFDKNRQSIAGRTTILAHQSSLYVGLRSKKPIIQAKKKAFIEALVVEIDGKRQSGVPIDLQVLQQKTTRTPIKLHGAWAFQYKSKEIRVAGCKLMSAKDIVKCAIRVPQAGYYTLQAKVKDAQGRWNTTRMGIYAYGKSYVPWKTNHPERLELIADQKQYKPGQSARILIKSPFRSALGILTIERNGIAEHRPIALTGSAQAINIKIRREYLPNLWVAVSIARGRIPLSQLGLKASDGAEDLGRPAYAFGQVQLKVSLTEKQIRVKVTPSAEKIRPGGKLRIKLRTSDHKGRPVRGVVTLALVDEGVLSLLGFKTPAPLRAFHTQRPAWAVLKDLRVSLLKRKLKPKKLTKQNNRRYPHRRLVRINKSRIVLRESSGSTADTTTAFKPASAPPAQAAPGGGGLRFAAKEKASGESRAEVSSGQQGQGGRGPSFQVRTRFATTAYYQAIVNTDSKGEATLTVAMPDNLTTFRIMAVAIDAVEPDRFGHGEGSVIVRKPLLLRPSLPRFANYGDRFEASVVINNETGKDGLVDVFARGINVAFVGKQRAQVQIPAGEAREVRFPVAIEKTGIARFQFAAILGRETDAVESKIPVLVPATAEAFATYGTTNNSVAQSVAPPKDAISLFGGLKISLSSTALTGLEDAVKYLIEYPFECTEQTASRAMPIFALRKILPAFKIGKVSDVGKMKAFATRAVTRLVQRQRYDGGWGYWSGSRYSYMYLSSYVTYALLRAKAAGYKVPDQTLAKAQQFLRNRMRYSPLRWERNNPTLRTMAAWVLSEIKPNIDNELGRLYRKRKQLPLFAKAWLMVTLHRHDNADPRVKSLLRVLNNQAIQLPGRVHFAERKTESLRMLMHSEDRTDAIVLQAFLEVRPKHALIPKIVRGLMRSRVRGRWSTTQSNAFAMLALSRYFAIYEKVVPQYRVQSWLGNGYLGTTRMKGRSMTITDQQVPMSFLQKQGKQNLVLAKRGKGRLYYRLGLRYAPKSLKLKAEEQGFSISRRYEAVGQKDDVQFKGGKWRFRAGAYVKVSLRIIATGQRYFVAVVDPLPAGLEPMNLGFKTSASAALRQYQTRTVQHSYSWYSYFAFNHHEKRDSMVVLFADRLPAGVYEYTYVARATTIGSFVIPPTRAEEMYAPEIFGRNATAFATVFQP